jgi:ABC-type glycerol-3-phosphate transport system substrate-binding protein
VPSTSRFRLPAVVLTAALLLGACSSDQSRLFPRLVFEAPVITLPGQATPSPTPSTPQVRLRIALDASQEAIDAVAALHVGMETGALSADSENRDAAGRLGAEVDLADLLRFAEGYAVEVVAPPPQDGGTYAYLMQAAAGTLPDLYVADALPLLVRGGITTPLDGLPVVEEALRQGRVVPTALAACRYDGHLQAIPYYASTQLLHYNLQPLQDAGLDVGRLEAGIPFPDFAEYLTALSKPADKAFALLDAIPLLSLLPASLDPALGWATHSPSGFGFRKKAFSTTVSTLRGVVKSQTTLNHLTTEQRTKLYGVVDPRTIGKVAFWIDDSTTTSDWRLGAVLPIGVAPIPFLDSPVLPIRIRTIVVNPDGGSLEAALRFACFLATDPDSLRMQARFGFPAGMLPMVDDPDVWKDCIGDGPDAQVLSSLRSLLPYAVVDAAISVDEWMAALDASIGTHGPKLLQGQETVAAVAGEMDDAADRAVGSAVAGK